MPEVRLQGAEADVRSRFEDWGLIRAAGKPLRKRTVVRAPSSKAKAAKKNKRRTKRKD